MGYLDRLHIKTRMVLAFVIVVTMFVLFGLFTIRELNTLGGLTKTLYEHPLRVSNAALSARLAVLRMHRSMKDIVLSDTPFELENDVHAVREAEKLVYTELDVVKQYILGQEGTNLANLARKTFLEWNPIRTEVIDLVMQGRKEAATVVSKTKSADHVNLLETRMQDLSVYARNKADGFMGDAKKVENEILTNTIVFIALTALFSTVIAYLLISSILASIMTLKNKMSDITTTGALSTATLAGKNEITDMASYFNKLIERLKGQLWLKDGQNELNMELSGQRNYEALLSGSINFISRYVDACTGALYSYDDQKTLCELKASYAFVERDHLSNAFRLGEGIIGQVAVEKKSILLRNITKETAIARTGTQSEPPTNIYALPLIYEDRLYGVLEVASFESLNGLKREFLDTASQTVSNYFYTISQKKKIDRLLLDTQNANEKLKLQAAELQALNRELKKQTEELHQQNVTLENQRRQVEEANRLKSEFLSNMSHELRTPLNSINALSRILLLQTREHLSEEEANYLEIIERNGKHLLSLINNILDLSKIEAGKTELNIVKFSLKSLLETIMEGMEPVAREKGIELAVHIQADLPWIESDESKVHQIVQNIIGNAVKFTDQGRVTLSAFFDALQVSVRVEDTGIGISEIELPHIFEEFRQADGSMSRRYEGTGLGLAIAHKAAKMLGGDIQVSSLPGQGSIFTVTLPLFHTNAPMINGQGRLLTSIPAGASSKHKKILVIDDDPSAADLISDQVDQLGYDVITARSGLEGIRLARQHQPFAITLDLIMAEMDGWEVLQNLKKTPDTSDIPVIIISRVEDRKVAFALGATEYVTKPVNPNELISVIYQISGSHPRKLLIVDDNELDRMEMARAVGNENVEILFAESGSRCLEMIDEILPDLLVLDLVMPGMDGFEVLENIRLRPETKDLPVIITTAKDLSTQEKEMLKGKNLAVVPKDPQTSKVIVKELRQALNRLEHAGRVPKVSGDLSPQKILLIEDNEAAVIQVKKVLQGEGYQVDVARDGRSALEYIRKDPPDGIILDLMMPDMDGFDILEKIRAAEETQDLPILILTAKDLTKDDLKRLEENRIQHLMQKGGLDREGLISRTKRLFEKKKISNAVPPRPVRRTPLILIVEDNLDNLTTIKAIIKDKYNVIEAVDGAAGMEKIIEYLPDLVLLDMSLPEMDGIAVVRALRKNDRAGRIPVIALTAHAMKGHQETFLAEGCDDYLPKPVDPEHLRRKIDSWIHRYGSEKK